MTRTTRPPLAVLTAVLLLAGALAGCSNDTTVGSSSNVDKVKDKGQGRVGGFDTPTATPSAVRSTKPAQATKAPVATRPPTAPRTTAPRQTQQAAVFRVKIVSAAQGFDPVSFRVIRGTHVVVTNTDKTAHTFTSDTGKFDSKSIAPGASWTYVASVSGVFPFHDETRPFATGQMTVNG